MAIQQAYGTAGFMDNPLYQGDNPTDVAFWQRLQGQANQFQLTPENIAAQNLQNQYRMQALQDQLFGYRENQQARQGMSFDPRQSSSMASIMPAITGAVGAQQGDFNANMLAQQQQARMNAAQMMAGGAQSIYGQRYNQYFNPVMVNRGQEQQQQDNFPWAALGTAVGMAVGGPPGAMAGNYLGSQFGNKPAGQSAQGSEYRW